MTDYVFTGFGCLGFLIYGWFALRSETLSFNWKLAFGILVGIFIFETIVNLAQLLFKKQNKKLKDRAGPKVTIIPPGTGRYR